VRSSFGQLDVPAHGTAVAITTAAIVLFLLQWWMTPRAVPVREPDAAMQAFFIVRVAPRKPPVPSPTVAGPIPQAPHGMPPMAPEQIATSRAQSARPLTEAVYAADGQLRLPASMAIDPLKPVGTPPGLRDERATQAARAPFERRNPIEYRPTRFDKYWATDGTLGDVALEKIGNSLHGVSSIGRFVLGEDHPAEAKPPPDVRFNPALHERPSDLGSEATGDAYKAAPIAFEQVPGLKGEASRRIRARIDEVRQRFASCDSRRMQELLAPAEANMTELEHIERAMANGVDPVQAEHLMPRSADRAYDLARRALWYAEKQLARCAAVPGG